MNQLNKQMIIRKWKANDASAIKNIYQDAFAGYPWYESLTPEEVDIRWCSYSKKRGFDCLVAEEAGVIIGAFWWDTPTLEELGAERGWEMVEFVKKQGENCTIIWQRDMVVSPQAQKRGIASAIREYFFQDLPSKTNTLLLTRMRDDNFSILRVNQKFGFQTTGIIMSSSQKPGVNHQYWYLLVP